MACDLFGWFCSHATHHAAHGAPEIDGGALGLAVVLVVGVLTTMKGRKR